MKVDELTTNIEEAAGLSFNDVPRTTGFSWFQSPTGKPVVLTVGQPCPLRESMIVYAMFHNDDVVRVYALSQNKDKPLPSTRYTLTKSAPTYVVETMPLDLFVDEIAEELQLAAGLDDDDDLPDDLARDEVDPPSDALPKSADSNPSTNATMTP